MSVPETDDSEPSSVVTSGSSVRGDLELYPTGWSRDSHVTITHGSLSVLGWAWQRLECYP